MRAEVRAEVRAQMGSGRRRLLVLRRVVGGIPRIDLRVLVVVIDAASLVTRDGGTGMVAPPYSRVSRPICCCCCCCCSCWCAEPMLVVAPRAARSAATAAVAAVMGWRRGRRIGRTGRRDAAPAGYSRLGVGPLHPLTGRPHRLAHREDIKHAALACVGHSRAPLATRDQQAVGNAARGRGMIRRHSRCNRYWGQGRWGWWRRR